MKLIRDAKEALLVIVGAMSFILCWVATCKIGEDILAGAPAPSYASLELWSTGIFFAISVLTGSGYLLRRHYAELLTDLFR